MIAIDIKNLNKSYENGLKALKNINLSVRSGEIFALLGPNGAGKSTLINIICGISKKTSGKVTIFGKDNILDYKFTRSKIGLVPQEIATDSFEKVINTLKFSRGLFNKVPSDEYLSFILKSLNLVTKKNNQIRTLSGGMKRRVMIAKALSHEPKILFLDEPTAGVDVNLRKTLWNFLNKLKKNGVTIFLTTHYIEEAENIADRIGIINNGEILITENKKKLIEKLGEKKIIITINNSHNNIAYITKKYQLKKNKNKLSYIYNSKKNIDLSASLLSDLVKSSVKIDDIEIEKSNLEEIFLNMVEK
ncbi:MAG: ABC transporter ATP-binding protein [Alphaproteobacteria bacterium]|nr:MAG: ABC transporter ATP-binding protein [Alphaproteobacteria bacterium]